ncbi:leucine-rich repeat protein (plasmid) [Herpetosiphon aurantiacus DSM 785]|uniref:Leucine-rich repeat protein n=1 Tax=Herpetosiphon aurantiacus (strain ATCC 23779 / DSM 785 / 114-95) TaxID=316274 RepID=A9B973_HERA2|nr:leucine-rich repeat protein [Herpetosiphon aurantiacus DSM 785]
MYRNPVGRIYPQSISQDTLLDYSSLDLTDVAFPHPPNRPITTLDLSRNQIKRLSINSTDANLITRIILHDNEISDLPSDIRSFRNLQELYVAGCPLTTLPTWLEELTHLRILDIGDTDMMDCPPVLRRLPNLSTLALANLPWMKLPHWFGDLPITTLSLYGMPQCDLSVIAELRSLNQLFLTRMHYTQIPTWLQACTRLTFLDLSDNPITTLPPWLGKLSLETLILGRIRLERYPDWEQWNSLTTLDLVGCENADAVFSKPFPQSLHTLILDTSTITAVPECIRLLRSLRDCRLAHTTITSVPTWLFEEVALQSLDLSYTHLEFPALTKPSMLITFIFRGGRTSTWPSVFDQMPMLQLFDLEDAYFDDPLVQPLKTTYHDLKNFTSPRTYSGIPFALAMPNLQTLHMSAPWPPTSVDTLHMMLEHCPQLQAISLLGWNLDTIPTSMQSLSDLRSLSVPYNQITEVPIWLQGMTKLRSLDISHNRLTQIPIWLRDMPHLESLDLSGNPLQTFPSWLKDIPTLSEVAFVFPPASLQCDHVLPEFLAAGIRLDVRHPRDDP